MDIDWKNTGALPLSASERRRLEELKRKDLDEGLTEAEQREAEA